MASHAQKYFLRHDAAVGSDVRRRVSIHDIRSVDGSLPPRKKKARARAAQQQRAAVTAGGATLTSTATETDGVGAAAMGVAGGVPSLTPPQRAPAASSSAAPLAFAPAPAPKRPAPRATPCRSEKPTLSWAPVQPLL